MDPNTPLEETMGALATAVQSGKAIYAGLSNYNGETLEKATAILNELHVPFVINQNRYSIFDRTIEHNGLKETANRLGKGIIAFSPLAQGLLTDRYLHGIPADSRVRTDGRFLKESALTEEKLAQIRALNEIAAARGQTLAEMALAWILKDGQVTSVLIGASRPEQILDNIKALDNTTFTAEELEAIDKASDMKAYTGISADKGQDYDVVLGVINEDVYYMLHITKATVATDATVGTTIEITGQYKH